MANKNNVGEMIVMGIKMLLLSSLIVFFVVELLGIGSENSVDQATLDRAELKRITEILEGENGVLQRLDSLEGGE